MSENDSKRAHHLYALMLKLRPREGGEILPNAGQLAHAALLAWLGAVDAELAARLHQPNQDRPFTCSSLWFPNEREVALAQRENRRLRILPGQVYWLRLTLLADPLFRTLTQRFLQPVGGAAPGEPGLPELRLGSVRFNVAELIATGDLSGAGASTAPSTGSWAGYASYEGLVEHARTLDLGTPGARTLGLEFRSPTAFSDGQRPWGKRMHLFPSPNRVYDRLARVWNAWAPPALALDVRAVEAYAREWAIVAQFALETRAFHFDRHAQVGFTGRCRYELMDLGHKRSTPAAEAAAVPATLGAGLSPGQVLHLLTSFSFFAGVGQKTTMGMGQARPLTPSARRADARENADAANS